MLILILRKYGSQDVSIQTTVRVYTALEIIQSRQIILATILLSLISSHARRIPSAVMNIG